MTNETGSTNQTHEPICSKCGEECIIVVILSPTGKGLRAKGTEVSLCCEAPVIVVRA